MNSIDQMFANLLSKVDMTSVIEKMIPPEIVALLAPENIQEIKEAVSGFVFSVRQDLDVIKQQNVEIIAMQESLLAIAERIENGGRGTSARNSRKSGTNGTVEPVSD